MSEADYHAREVSPYSGEPIEGYKFSLTTPLGTTVWRYTSADTDITLPVEGVFTATPISRGRTMLRQDDFSGSVEIYVPFTFPIVTLFQTTAPEWPISVTIFRAHRGEETTTTLTIFVGTIAGIVFGNEQATLGCAPITARLSLPVPNITFQGQCVWNLYGVGCGAVRGLHEFPATLTVVNGVQLTAAAFDGPADGWFNNGYVQADATGQMRFIVDHVGSVITLSIPFVPQLLVGATVKAYAGCDRTEQVCASKFNNLDNHLGFPRIPQRNPHDLMAHGQSWRSWRRRDMNPRGG